MGAVDIAEWACVLCGCHIQNEQVEQWIASNCVLSLNIPPWKLFGWFRRPQLRATGDWQLHPDNAPAHTSRLMQNFFAKHQITQVTQPPYSPNLTPCNFWFFQNWNQLWKGRDFRLSMRFRKIQQGSWWQLGELCEVPTCLPKLWVTQEQTQALGQYSLVFEQSGCPTH